MPRGAGIGFQRELEFARFHQAMADQNRIDGFFSGVDVWGKWAVFGWAKAARRTGGQRKADQAFKKLAKGYRKESRDDGFSDCTRMVIIPTGSISSVRVAMRIARDQKKTRFIVEPVYIMTEASPEGILAKIKRVAIRRASQLTQPMFAILV